MPSAGKASRWVVIPAAYAAFRTFSGPTSRSSCANTTLTDSTVAWRTLNVPAPAFSALFTVHDVPSGSVRVMGLAPE